LRQQLYLIRSQILTGNSSLNLESNKIADLEAQIEDAEEEKKETEEQIADLDKLDIPKIKQEF
jgi:cell division protein FtsL